ncbi:hypothetical protein EJ04DRAFT_572681 [Polyplosphaeria fusca]|uniref:BZIP domain-containing protein n=1 Tax=Polyplosphaeria fusca TaxID=682080 RepID=A0A9P4R8B5_9PLEO|nr:hypothetical protein EJ04DRAFT_572681 [Polyplosphaeria fusca]
MASVYSSFSCPFARATAADQSVRSMCAAAQKAGAAPAQPRSSSQTTFPTYDFTSFTTASQQSSWLPSPAPQALRPLLPSQTEFAAPQSDFVLFDQPAQVSQRPPRAPSALQPTFNPSQRFYANSAPSSTTEFHQPQQRRPPVPLFPSPSNSFSTSTNQQQNVTMADLNTNNSFDSNLGAGLGPAYGTDMSWDFQTSAFTSINPSVGSQRTVSPKDIFQDPLGSAPPSTAFTNLTSPDINESPWITDSIECSPAFQAGDSFSLSTDNWFPLFPEDKADISPELERSFSTTSAAAPDLERTISTTSMARSSSSSTNSPAIRESAHRRKSSVNINGSPATNASVSKSSRRRKGPLPPIAVDPHDKVALKRARNTLAARDSRQRKFEHVATLEKRNAELEAELEKWKAIAIAQGYTDL